MLDLIELTSLDKELLIFRTSDSSIIYDYIIILLLAMVSDTWKEAYWIWIRSGVYSIELIGQEGNDERHDIATLR